MSDEATGGLRLLAQDAADVGVIAAAAQDAVIRPAQLVFEPSAKRVTAPMARFRWETAAADHGHGPDERVQAALQVSDVLSARVRGLDMRDEDAVTVLLTIGFEPEDEGPGGVLRLVFAEAGEIALTVECVDVALADVSDPWAARRRPRHQS